MARLCGNVRDLGLRAAAIHQDATVAQLVGVGCGRQWIAAFPNDHFRLRLRTFLLGRREEHRYRVHPAMSLALPWCLFLQVGSGGQQK